MTYDDIAAVFLAALDEPIEEPDVATTSANVSTERWLGFALGEDSATRGFGADVLDAAVEHLEAGVCG